MSDPASAGYETEPVAGRAGTNPSRERRWGLVGGIVGSLTGLGMAGVAVALDGAPLWEASWVPSFFREARPLALDSALLLAVVAGAGFSLLSLIYARTSPWPRSDCYGAGLMGTILSALAGAILFLRVLALTR